MRNGRAGEGYQCGVRSPVLLLVPLRSVRTPLSASVRSAPYLATPTIVRSIARRTCEEGRNCVVSCGGSGVSLEEYDRCGKGGGSIYRVFRHSRTALTPTTTADSRHLSPNQ